MTWLDLRAGYRCNNRCRFCDQGDRRDTLGDAPLDALVAVLHRERAHADAVWLAGGEITLRPDLPRLVEAARAAGYTRVGMQTNGRILAAPGAADALRARGLTDAVVALHAGTPALHDWLVQADGAFKQASVGLRRLVAAGVATRVATVLTRSGTAEIPALAELALRLGAEGHRWILARPDGAAAAEWRMLLPRLALVRGPVVDAVHRGWERRREAETVGLPLCVLGDARAAAADRVDAPATLRAFPNGFAEVPPLRRYGPPCDGCPLRAACPGAPAAYVDRYGWDELVAPGDTARVSRDASPAATPNAPPGALPAASTRALHSASAAASQAGPPPPRGGRAPATAAAFVRAWRGGDPVPGLASAPPASVLLHVEAACPLACASCATRDAYAAEAAHTARSAGAPAPPAWPTEPERALRQRLVRAASEGAARVVFAGASPWSHPGLPGAVREARRLGFADIEVWGPLEPAHALPVAAADKLAGLTRVRAPRLGPDAGPDAPAHLAAARAWFAAHLPVCAVELYDLSANDTPPDTPMYQSAGPRAVWASCQRPPD